MAHVEAGPADMAPSVALIISTAGLISFLTVGVSAVTPITLRSGRFIAPIHFAIPGRIAVMAVIQTVTCADFSLTRLQIRNQTGAKVTRVLVSTRSEIGK